MVWFTPTHIVLSILASLLVTNIVIKSYYVKHAIRFLRAPSACRQSARKVKTLKFRTAKTFDGVLDTSTSISIPYVREFKGEKGVNELASFITKNDLFQDIGHLNDGNHEIEFSTGDNDDQCKVVVNSGLTMKLGTSYFGKDKTFNFAVGAKFILENQNSRSVPLLKSVDISLPDKLSTRLGNYVNSRKSAKLVCGSMMKNCRSVWKKNGFAGKSGMKKCLRKFKALSKHSSGEANGNSQTCRIIAAQMAGTSGSEFGCAHISFKPMKDPRGDNGCKDQAAEPRVTKGFSEAEREKLEKYGKEILHLPDGGMKIF